MLFGERLELRWSAENESTVLAERSAGAHCLADDCASEASSAEVEHDVDGVIGEGGAHNLRTETRRG